MAKVDWILGQVLFWLLVAAIIITALVGIRRAGAVLAAHQAGLVGGRSVRGPGQGLIQAGSDLYGWWGASPADAARYVEVESFPERRSLVVRVRGAMQTLFGGTADLGAGSFQRWEDLYLGPPDEWE